MARRHNLLYAAVAVMFIAITGAFAATDAKETLDPSDFKDVSISIKYYDRTVYYPFEAESNPVYVHISIKNNSTETLRFKLADDRMFSVDFNVYDVKNRQLNETEALLRKRTTDKSIYFREISIENGEEYSFIENLKDYIDITAPSIYYVELKFFPELYKFQNLSLTSNRLTLEVRPSPAGSASAVVPVKDITKEILQTEDISPDRVVEQTIIARQKSLWDQYFLYMDIESMYQRNAAQKRKYANVSANERDRLLQEYKADLMQQRIDIDIVAVPSNFEIEKTIYSKTQGEVTVIEWFAYPNFYEKKSYVYKIRRHEGIWQIYDYTVTNLGTE